MLAKGDGLIVNICSVAGSIKGVPNRFAYGITKAVTVGLQVGGGRISLPAASAATASSPAVS